MSKQKEPENLSPKQRKAKIQEELADRLRIDSRKKQLMGLLILVAVVAVCGGLYYFIYKPYSDAMNLIEQSDQYVASENYTEALKSLSKARILAPYMKGLQYRAGLIQLEQMDYYGAEDMFNKEIAQNGHIPGAEFALGFMCTIDGLLLDKQINVNVKKVLIEEISKALQIDITLSSDQPSLGINDTGGYQSAITHFAKSRDLSKEFESVSSVGLAYAHALDGNRNGGTQSYAKISELAARFPMLAGFYNGIESKMGIGTDLVADAGDETADEWVEDESAVEENAEPQIPVEELPPIPEDIQIQPLATSGEYSSRGQLPPNAHQTRWNPEPRVKPFKLSTYLSKDGERKFTITLLNIRDRGKSIAREGQVRTMPNNNVEVLVIKLSEEEIILKEDNLYTFRWTPQRNSWVWVKDEE